MDWLGNADHDNGYGSQYAWWTIQKTTDIYHNPPWFTAPYTYERSVNWPNGHRNVIFAGHGIRPLPRGSMQGDESTGTADTKMLYAYLRHFQGICAKPHQHHGHGHRLAQQRPAGRAGGRDLSGRPQQLRVRRGTPFLYRRRVAPERPPISPSQRDSFSTRWPRAIASVSRVSSDHISTHSSYGIALVEKPGRDGLLEAFPPRRCYAATDNILLVVKCGDHLMGEEFTFKEKPTLHVHAEGTGPIARIEIVNNDQYVYNATPNQTTVNLKWTDAAPLNGGTVYYYVHVQQADTNLAWSSPVWIH